MFLHNEAPMLPLSLPSLYGLDPDEIIVLLDRCTNESLDVAKKIASHYDPEFKLTKLLEIDKPADFRSRIGFLMNRGIEEAANNLVLITGADLILDPRIGLFLHTTPVPSLVSFSYIDFPVNWRNLIQRLVSHFPIAKSGKLAGVLAVNREVLMDCVDLQALKRIELAVDTFWQTSIQAKHPTSHILSRTIHLRPTETKERHYLKGKLYWNVAKRPFLKTLANALITLRFDLIRGYIHARFGAAET